MSDILDIASDYIEATTQAAIEQIRQNTQGHGTDQCEECDSDIPLARRTLLPNTQYCVDCATQMEEAAKRYGKR